jgi:hypothetical protein
MEGPTPLQIYEFTRSKYTHEDSWIQQRVGWLLTANGFLFAGYGALLALTASVTDVSREVAALIKSSLILISAIGLGLPLLVGAGVFAAFLSKKSAIKEWNELVVADIRLLFPSIEATAKHKWLGSLASGGLCGFLVGVWLFILLKTLSHLQNW